MGLFMRLVFAGLAATIWAVIVPALMAKASRKRYPNNTKHQVGALLALDPL